jgi:hypothetical protein
MATLDHYAVGLMDHFNQAKMGFTAAYSLQGRIYLVLPSLWEEVLV